MDIKRLPGRVGRYLKSLLTNGYFYVALAGLGVFCALSLLFVSKIALPAFTRHSSFVSVPDLTNLSYEEAARVLERNDLTPDRRIAKFRPELPRDVVVEQNPQVGSSVKPGRRVYLTVNSGTVPTVIVPNVIDLAIQEAKNRLTSAGLRVVETRPDPIPSPYRDTITRTSPPPGATVDKGSEAILWYSEGMGSQYVDVPDLVGMTVNQAERALFELKLRSIAVDATAATDSVRRQSHAPGTRVREGFEVRLYTIGGPEDQDQ